MDVNINNQILPIKICNTLTSRFLGMMFKKKKAKVGYFFPNCNSIHTFFMFQSIDVIMTNKENKVVQIYRNVKPNRILLPKKEVFNIYEFSSGIVKKVQINDKIKTSR